MRKTFLFLLTFVFVVSAVYAQEDGFKTIFNGKNLEGWVIQGLEKAGPKVQDDGVLAVDGWDYWAVLTKKQYGDFILRFDCKFDKKGNSGVVLTTAVKEAYKKELFEIQLAADPGEVDKKCTGSLFTSKGCFQVPDKNPTKALGEWNSVEVKYQGKKLTLIINGTTVYDNLDLSKNENLKLTDKFNIGFQRNDYKKAVYFKNIRVKEL